jgi:hypothetical protein
MDSSAQSQQTPDKTTADMLTNKCAEKLKIETIAD